VSMFVLLPECNIKFLIWLAAGFLAYYNCLRFPPFSRKLFQLLWVCQDFRSAVSCDKCKQWHWCCLAFFEWERVFLLMLLFSPAHIYFVFPSLSVGELLLFVLWLLAACLCQKAAETKPKPSQHCGQQMEMEWILQWFGISFWYN